MDIYTGAIVVSLLVYIAVGNYAGRRVKRLDDYFVAGRRAPTLLIVGTLVASLFSTTAFLGEAGFAYAGQAGPFLLWPPLGASRMKDVRPVRMRPEIDGREIVRGEDRAVGNISDRVFLVAQLVNSEIAQRTRENVIPNRVFHSDEAGRPFVSDCNLPVAAFLPPGPRNRMILINGRDELSRFVFHHQRHYRLYINPACVDRLGLQRNMFSWD